MAIFRRDRSFSKIINEVDVESIPIHFIKRLKISLIDGSVVIIDQEELQKVESIESLLMASSFVHELVDMSIELDYDGIEEDVTEQVNRLLNYKDNDKQDD